MIYNLTWHNGQEKQFSCNVCTFLKYRNHLDFEGWHIRKRECFCQSFDLWDTYLIKTQAFLMIILAEWKHTHGTLTKLLWAKNVFYFVFKLPFLNMQNILNIFLLPSSFLRIVFNVNRKRLILIPQRELRKSGKRTLEF